MDEILLTGGKLKRVMREAANTAAGVDQVKAADFGDLPEEAFDELAELWHTVLRGAPLPDTWVQVRTVTIPKDEGGYRGLSIAAQMWRTCMSATIQALGGKVATGRAPRGSPGPQPGRLALPSHDGH